MRLFFFCYLVLALLPRSLRAQPALHLFADSVTGHLADTVTVPIRAMGFTQMLTFQGTLAFDSSVVQIVGAQPGALPGLSNANFGSLGHDYLTFAWFDQTLAGQSLPDSAVLFSLRFHVVGPIGTRTPVAFTDSPTVVECVRVGFQPVVPTRHRGAVTIVPGMALPADLTVPLAGSVYPNPAASYLIMPDDRAVWVSDVATGRTRVVRPAFDGLLDVGAWPVGTYVLRPVGTGRASGTVQIMR